MRTSLTSFDLDGPGGADPAAITSSLLALFIPEFGKLPPNTPLRIDIAPTIAHLLGTDMRRGPLTGRVLSEALRSGPAGEKTDVKYLRSSPANGRQTILVYQEFDGLRYLDKACIVSSSTSDTLACR